jgi:hypothetical protein
MVAANDRRAIEAALDTVVNPREARVGRIRSTSHLKTFWVSKPVLNDFDGMPAITIHPDPVPVRFDLDGWLLKPPVV